MARFRRYRILIVVYSIGIFAIERRAFYGLSQEDQAVVRDVMTNTVNSLDRDAREDEREARAVLEKTGMNFVPVNSNSVMGWRHTIDALYPQLQQRSDIDAAVLEQVLDHLRDYRSFSTSPR